MASSKTAASKSSKPRATPPKASASSSSRSASTSKPQARSQDSAKLEFSSAGVQTPVPDDLAALDKEQQELQKPGQVSKASAAHIDADPGYDKDQVAHMEEYYGLSGNHEKPGTDE